MGKWSHAYGRADVDDELGSTIDDGSNGPVEDVWSDERWSNGSGHVDKSVVEDEDPATTTGDTTRADDGVVEDVRSTKGVMNTMWAEVNGTMEDDVVEDDKKEATTTTKTVEPEPKTMRMISNVLRDSNKCVAPPKRRKAKAKRSKVSENLGNIKLYFSKEYLSKDQTSNNENDGGASRSKRKVEEGLEVLTVQKSKRSKLTSMEATNEGGLYDSRTVCPNVLGGISFCGREPGSGKPDQAL